eukprot:g11421.t1 g11421   contig5:802702-805032(-)
MVPQRCIHTIPQRIRWQQRRLYIQVSVVSQLSSSCASDVSSLARASLPLSCPLISTHHQQLHRFSSSVANKDNGGPAENQSFKRRPSIEDDGLTLSHFVSKSSIHVSRGEPNSGDTAASDCSSAIPMAANLGDEFDDYEAFVEQDLMVTDAMSSSTQQTVDRLGSQMINGNEEDEDRELQTMKFHIKTYGCQMNVNDTDIVRSILLNHNQATGVNVDATDSGESSLQFIETTDEIQADILLTNTCAIRENAESKVWHRLRELRSHDRNYPLSSVGDEVGRLQKQRNVQSSKEDKKKRIIGVLGCMAERLKEDMFQDGTADLVVGPDSYRDLPRLISVLNAPATGTLPTERAVNVQLSLDETYASIKPIRSNPNDVSAFVSIMRGCNNMCSYCVVPFTRGRERSRGLENVVDETRRLVEEEGIKEVILLGQNVNSYHDIGDRKRKKQLVDDDKSYQTSNPGFSNMFRLRNGDGHRFLDLLDAVSLLSPELRVRFTSPHPKDYPPPLLTLMAERPNICSHLHMPAQSGSSSVLERMRRGYTREAYLELIDDVRRLIPDVAISSDFITGFCGETEEEHQDTLSLMEQVQFDQAFMFAYSMRGKTHAHRSMEDDVLPEVKQRRLNEVITVFRIEVQRRNDEVEVGKLRLVLVEGEAKRSTPGNRAWSGRTDQNKRVVFPDVGYGGRGAFLTEEEVRPLVSDVLSNKLNPTKLGDIINAGDLLKTNVGLSRGDYAVVQIEEARGHTLKGRALWRSSIVGFDQLMNTMPRQDALAELCESMI